MSIFLFFLRHLFLVELFVVITMAVVVGLKKFNHWYPKDRTITFVSPDNDEIVMMRLKTQKGEVFLSFGNGLVDVHDAYDSLELLMKAGVIVHSEMFPTFEQ